MNNETCEDCPDYFTCTEPCEKVAASLPNSRKPDSEALLGDMSSFSADYAHRQVFMGVEQDPLRIACRLLWRCGFPIRVIARVLRRSAPSVRYHLNGDESYTPKRK